MSSSSDELNYECDEALSDSSISSDEADDPISSVLDTSIKPPPPTPVPKKCAPPTVFRPISPPKGSGVSAVAPVKPMPRKKSPIRPPSSVKSVVIQKTQPPRYSPVSPPSCPEGPAAEPVLEVPSRSESPPEKQRPPPAQFRRKPNCRLPMVSGGKNRLMHQSVKDYRTLIDVRHGKALEGVEPADPKAVFAKKRDPPSQVIRQEGSRGRPDLTALKKIPLTHLSRFRETLKGAPVRHPDWRWVGCMKKPPSRRIHVHQRQLACMCVVVNEGYSISNGAATVSSEDVSDVMNTLCDMNVKSLVVTDEDTMNHWNTLKKEFSTFHPLNSVNVVMIDKERQRKIGKCMYCKQTVCHKWRAVMAMSMTIRHGLDHVRHEKKEETTGK